MKYIFLIILSLLIATPTLAANKPLEVPYTTQIPIGYWANPWSNACEESSVKMVDEYYSGTRGKISKNKAIKIISPLFTYENKTFGENYDSNSYRTMRMINDNTIFTGEIIYKPSLQRIKNHLKLGFPVISFHNGFALPNQNLHFRAIGSGYHVMVINGFDNKTKTFITNDPGDTVTGYKHQYDYTDFLNTLGDFDHITKKVNKNKPKVILTYPKLVKIASSSKIYYLRNNIKYYISSPAIFKKNKWEMKNVITIEDQAMKRFKKTATLTNANPYPPKDIIAKTKDKDEIYYIVDGIKHYVTRPSIFKKRGWKVSEIQIVEEDWLKSIPKGRSI